MKSKTGLPKTLTTVTTLSKLLAVFLIFAFILTGVFVGRVYQRMIDTTAFSTYLSSTNTNTHATQKITIADNGKTIQTHVGDFLDFELSSVTTRWTLSFSSPILRQVPLGIAQRGGGQEGRYLVTKAGTVVVTGTGVANCPQGTPCPMYAMRFDVVIVASK